MSSRVQRGGDLAAEPMEWRSVGSSRALAAVAPDVAAGAPGQPLNASPAGVRLAKDPESRSRGAYQQGLQEGQAAARKETASQIEAMNKRMARSIEEFSSLRQRFRHEAEEDVVQLALAIARRILHRELSMAPDALLGIVKAALQKIEMRELHRIRVRPEDAAMVKQFLDKMGLPQRVEVTADPGLERGAVILDSGRGAVDASIETQLAEIERGLADIVRRV